MRFRANDLRRQGWELPQTLQIPDWCGCSIEYLPVPVGDGWWTLVPIWQPYVTPSPLRRWEPAVPYWARTHEVHGDTQAAVPTGGARWTSYVAPHNLRTSSLACVW
jgi:hypothetical protein